MKDHARGPVVDTVQDASPQVTAMIDKIALDNLRYKILHAAARITRGARRRQLKIQATWPWAADIVTAFDRISALAHAPDQHSACPIPITTPPRGRWNPRPPGPPAGPLSRPRHKSRSPEPPGPWSLPADHAA